MADERSRVLARKMLRMRGKVHARSQRQVVRCSLAGRKNQRNNLLKAETAGGSAVDRVQMYLFLIAAL